MSNYIDAFVLPIPRNHLDAYKKAAEEIAEIWKEHGALAYNEYLGEDLKLEGTRSFTEFTAAKEDEVIIFGWVVFESLEKRDIANRLVAADPRMIALVAPLINPSRVIFDASRMTFGGFEKFISSTSKLDKN